MTPYLIDTNFFIQAHRVGFPMDVMPSFWIKVSELAHNKKIISIDKVKKEIYKREDDLKIWCEANLPVDFFKDSSTIITAYSEVVRWAYSKKDWYKKQALDTFMDAEEADAWLVAFAYAQNLPLVTHEISKPESKKDIKIPDACIPFSVRTLLPMDMLRELGEKI